MLNVNIKTKICSGQHATEFLQKIHNKKILIVCDEFMAHESRIKFLTDALIKNNEVRVFDKAIPDPTLDVCVEGVKVLLNTKADVVIGYGGGSPIDTAKAIIYFACADGKVKKPLLIAVPTTSGTGSEVTSVSVIRDAELDVKHLLVSEDILPDIALLDPTLTLSVPPSVTANTGIDVLTHALEAYVAKGSNVLTDAMTEKSVGLLFKYLLTCYTDGNNYSARQRMQESSTLAGMAFNHAGLGLNHSIAHQLGATLHLPHGLANALLINKVIDFNSTDSRAKTKYAKLAYRLQIAESNVDYDTAINSLKLVISVLCKSMGIPSSISELGIDKTTYYNHIPKMVSMAMVDYCYASNPVSATEMDIEEILKAIY